MTHAALHLHVQQARPWKVAHGNKAELNVTSCRQRCVYYASDRVSIGNAGASRQGDTSLLRCNNHLPSARPIF